MERDYHNGNPAHEEDDQELSETIEKNLQGVLILFPFRAIEKSEDFITNETFDKVKNALTCPICLEIFKDPVFVKDCMHRFCKQCIERVIRG